MSMRQPNVVTTSSTAYTGDGKLAQVRLVAAAGGVCEADILDGGSGGTLLVTLYAAADGIDTWDAPRSGDIPFATDLYVTITGTAPRGVFLYHRDP